jgi:hypothetical protein
MQEEYELRRLSPDWVPWTWQINRYADGEAYGKPGERVRTSMINYENYDDALSYFLKLTA